MNRRIIMAGLSFGIAALALLRWQEPIIPAFVIIGLCALDLLFFIGLRTAHRQYCSWLLAGTIGLTWALLVHHHAHHATTPRDIEYYADESAVQVEGTIVKAPERRDDGTVYILESEKLMRKDRDSIDVWGRVRLVDRARWPRYERGDIILVTGTLARPEPFNDFAYDRYLAEEGIYAQLQRASVKPSNKPASFSLLRYLDRSRDAVETRITTIWPEPVAALMTGLLTGTRRGLPEELLEEFRVAGLTHILAISGYNISMIILILMNLLFFIPFYWRLPAIAVGIGLFTLFVGAESSVVRAAIMGVLGLLALQTSNVNDVRLALLWSAVFMLTFKPGAILYDAGFQLSFLAVIGLIELGPWILHLCRKLPETLGLREACAMTLAAQLTTLPIIAYHFQSVSLISPLSNVLAAPLIPLSMLFGAITLLVSLLSDILAQLIGIGGWVLLSVLIKITNISASLPLASLALPKINVLLLILSYVGMAGGILWIKKWMPDTR